MEEVIGSIPIRSTNQTNNLGRAFRESAELSSSGQPLSLFLGSSGQIKVKTVRMKLRIRCVDLRERWILNR
jgi:hypothetical protein